MKKLLTALFLLFAFVLHAEERMNHDWLFRIANDATADYSAEKLDCSDWQKVRLPHTPRYEKYYPGEQWQGICWYRHTIEVDKLRGEQLWLNIEGAMNVADVWVNGVHCTHHLGGYLPVAVDLTSHLHKGKNSIAVRLDNNDNPITGPRPMKKLDFMFYGGLYRNVSLIRKGEVAITHPFIDTTPAEGGVFVTYDKVSERSADVNVAVSVENDGRKAKNIIVVNRLLDGVKVVAESRNGHKLAGKSRTTVKSKMVVKNPRLWSHLSPARYTLQTTIEVGGKVVDEESRKIGIRSIEIKDNELYVNGKKSFLRGVNRHQCHPYIGYAVCDNAQVRDAVRIKEAGFDFVRLSHYPQSTAFLEACDSLGIFVLNCVFGWQYFNKKEPKFREFCYQQTRDMVRRDRNHPSILAWEASLNETKQPADFIAEMSRLVHEEYPAPYCYSAGWQRGYDIYVESRQFRIFNNIKDHDVPLIVSEYGDWEYYANDGGLTQYVRGWRQKPELTSRQLREDGERRMVQMVENVYTAHIDNLTSVKAMADGFWVMFDYNRGYTAEIEASGVMSLDRLPKYAYYYYRSLRPEGEPMVYIASYLDENSPEEKAIISNCEIVKLISNGNEVATLNFDTKATPMRTFQKVALPNCNNLTAVGYRNGKEVARHTVLAPEKAEKIALEVSNCGITLGKNDQVFVYVHLKDKNNTTPNFTGGEVRLAVEGDAFIEGEKVSPFRAGVASFVVRTGDKGGNIKVRAEYGAMTDSAQISF
ncbi:MAG: glycoside hydrolase family 2 protein [Alistipes sp.]|nr:glycoside hydrolase family 2 protein [Alistipes sp.]